MKAFDILRMALSAIVRNKVRSLLTALGIVIGVGSVIAMVHFGQSATSSVTQRIEDMGSNLLTVRTGTGGRGPGGVRTDGAPFDIEDVQVIRRDVSDIIVAPVVEFKATAVFGGENHATTVRGTSNEYFEIRAWELSAGRFFENAEDASSARLCLVGQTVVDELLSEVDPVGQTLRLSRTSCTVIGVLAERGASMGQDEDDVVIMPTAAVQRRLIGDLNVNTIYVSALNDGQTAKVKAALEALLRERRRIAATEEDDFHVRDMAEIAETLEGTTETLTLLLGAVAAVSLLVGGIGIMNIMLVSVTERTREIGIRMAIGARVRDVLWQFLLEAVVLSLLGGTIGVALGLAASVVAADQMNVPFELSVPTLAIGFGFSAIVGVVFGYFPARKAAHLNPIEALRHE